MRRRQGQLVLAQAVSDALARPGSRLAVEAPTGTGKTIALLVPAVLHRGSNRAVVSTHGNLLATRLAMDDLARIKAALDWSGDTTLLKGRGNYLCLERLYRNVSKTEAHELAAVARHREGDLTRMGLNAAQARRVNDDRRFCLGTACPHHEVCYSRLARESAKNAELVVTNHSLLLADVVARDNLLGSYDTLLLDEAHHLPQVAVQALAARVEPHSLARATAALQLSGSSREKLSASIAQLASLLESALASKERQVLSGDWPALSDIVATLDDTPVTPPGPDEGKRLAHGDWVYALAQLKNIRDSLTKDVMVVYVERTEHGPTLVAQPVRVSGFLRQVLYQCRRSDESVEMTDLIPRTVVATSATLRTIGSPDRFGYFLDQAGLGGAQTACVPGPFDRRRAVLYIPEVASLPSQDGSVDIGYVQRTAKEVVWASDAIGGGAFLLTTSWAWLRAYAGVLRHLTKRPLYIQEEDGNNDALLAAFMRRPGILVGTRRYWEGVDIPGRALSLVVIAKLPFPNPAADPVLESRMARARSSSQSSAFATVLLPEMLLALRQGIGRLVRTETDFGLVMVLDRRAKSAPYARHVVDAISHRLVEDRLGVVQFLQDFLPVQDRAQSAALA